MLRSAAQGTFRSGVYKDTSSDPMKALLVSSLILVMAALPLQAVPREWLTSVDEAFGQARDRDQRILVDLYADWCGWCKELEKNVFSTQIFQDFARDFVLLRVDTEDGGEGSRLQELYDAYSLPTTLVLDPNSVRVAEVKGYAPAAQYVGIVQREIGAFDELVRGFEQFGQSDDLRVLGILADEFHQRHDGDRAAELYRRMLATEQMAPDKSARIHYQLTDALRLAGQYEDAFRQLEMTRRAAANVEDQRLIERLELMAAQISLDSGDCDRARSDLEEFLGSYPSSELAGVARRNLRTLDSRGYRCS